uniref:NACHT domain-containing protein n=1 Tax=Callorhinchus milii TaxID=7868 RepID=A0A4W3HJQ7_CALMI
IGCRVRPQIYSQFTLQYVELHRRRLQQWFPGPGSGSGSGLEEPVLTDSWREEGGRLAAAEEYASGRALGLRDLFPGEAGETVVVYGAVGSGKTTLVRRLLLDWSRGEACGLERFGLVLPFSCQDLASASARPASLNRLVALKFGHLRAAAPGLWAGSLGPVLLLFSGLEQLQPPGLDFRLSRTPLCADPAEPLPASALLVNLLRKRLAPEASLLLTARPSALAGLPARYVQRCARLRGFAEAGQRLTYFRRRLESSAEAAAWLEAGSPGLAEALNRNLERQSRLAATCLLPSYCWLAAATLQLLRLAPAQASASPETLTGLYTRFLRLSFGGEALPVARSVARTVGRLAHRGIVRGQSSFSRDQLTGCFEAEAEASAEERTRLAAFRDDTMGFFFTPSPRPGAGPDGGGEPGTGLAEGAQREGGEMEGQREGVPEVRGDMMGAESLLSSTMRLCDNPMSEAAVQCLGAAIAGNRSLSHLSLARTCLGDVGVEALAGHLEANTHLKELNLAYNQLSDQAALRLMEVLLVCALFRWKLKIMLRCSKREGSFLKQLNAAILGGTGGRVGGCSGGMRLDRVQRVFFIRNDLTISFASAKTAGIFRANRYKAIKW